MIKARHSSIHQFLLHPYLRFIIKYRFRAIQYSNVAVQHDRPTLILANHISWWDGFLMLYFNQKHVHKKIHVMMLEEELAPRRFLSRIGAYSIKKKSRSLLESLEYTRELFQQPDNLIVIYPQGIITSLCEESIRFQKGIFKLFTKENPPIQILFAATFIDFAIYPKPTAYIHLSEYRNELSHEAIERGYQDFYRQKRTEQVTNIKKWN